MNCRKCGDKQITRRAAGIFSCGHCGVQPGPFHLDRGGNPTQSPAEIELPSASDYIFAVRQPKLQASFNLEGAI